MAERKKIKKDPEYEIHSQRIFLRGKLGPIGEQCESVVHPDLEEAREGL